MQQFKSRNWSQKQTFQLIDLYIKYGKNYKRLKEKLIQEFGQKYHYDTVSISNRLTSIFLRGLNIWKSKITRLLTKEQKQFLNRLKMSLIVRKIMIFSQKVQYQKSKKKLVSLVKYSKQQNLSQKQLYQILNFIKQSFQKISPVQIKLQHIVRNQSFQQNFVSRVERKNKRKRLSSNKKIKSPQNKIRFRQKNGRFCSPTNKKQEQNIKLPKQPQNLIINKQYKQNQNYINLVSSENDQSFSFNEQNQKKGKKISQQEFKNQISKTKFEKKSYQSQENNHFMNRQRMEQEVQSQPLIDFQNQSQINAEQKIEYKAFCEGGYQAFLLCNSEKCQFNSFRCNYQTTKCQLCKKNHKKCQLFSLNIIIESILQNKQKVNKLNDQLIDKIYEMCMQKLNQMNKIKQKIYQIKNHYGLNKNQSDFLQLLKIKKGQMPTGSQVAKIKQSLQGNRKFFEINNQIKILKQQWDKLFKYLQQAFLMINSQLSLN